MCQVTGDIPQEQYNHVVNGLKCLLSSCGATSIDLMLEIPWEMLIAIQDVLLELEERGVLRSVYFLHLEARKAWSQERRRLQLDRTARMLATVSRLAPLWESRLLKNQGIGRMLLGDHA